MGDDVTGIGLLGPVTVHRAGRPVDIRGAQRRAVLARLALSPGRVVTIDALVDDLWTEPPPTARKVVQVHVSRLRADLPPGVLASSGGGYRLDVDPHAIDAHRFTALVSAAGGGDAPDATIALLDEALALWRGPSLVDVGDVPFAAPAVAHLDETRMQAIERRLAAHLDDGRADEVVAELERLVREHPLRERLWAQLVAALGAVGRQADALRAYERARGELADIGLEPGDALRRAQDDVLAGPTTTAPVPAAATPDPATPAAPRRAPAPTPVPPALLVGRDADREVLRRTVDDAAAGTGPGFVAVRGEEGIGKSSLLAAAAHDATDRATVLTGRCRQHVALPFAPWVDVLEQLGADDLLALLGTDGDVDTAAARRVHLFAGTVDRVREAAASGPVVVLLDDLHWADDGTVDLLLHLLGEIAGERVVAVGAWRPGEVVVGHPATRLVGHLARVAGPTIDLAPLTAADIHRMLAGHAPEVEAADRDDAAERLLEVTSGVPLFVADAVGATGDRVPGLRVDLARLQVPDTARSIVARRLTEAGPDALGVAEAAAVLGEAATPELVAAVAGSPAADVLMAADDLARVGLMRDDVQFTHAAFRAAVVESVATGRRRVLHAAAAEHLRAAGASAVAVAHHVTGAGPLVDAAVALDARMAAGAEAAGRGAFADAVRWYEAAAASAPAERRATVRAAWADALWRSGEIAPAKALASDIVLGAITARSDPADPATLVRAAVLHASVGAGWGPDPESLDLLDRVLAVTTASGDRTRLLVAAAGHHASWGSPRARVHAATDAARDAMPDDAPAEIEAELRFAEALALIDHPDVARRVAVADDLVARGRALRAPRHIGRGLRVRAMAELSAGDLDAIERSIDELDAIAAATGSWMYAADVWRWRGTLALEAGDIDGLADALAHQDRIAADPHVGWMYSGAQHILVRRARGDLEGALRIVDSIRDLGGGEASRADPILADAYRLDLLHEMGRDDEARDELRARETWTVLDETSCRQYVGALALLARAAARTGAVEPASALLARLEPYAGQRVVLGWGEGLIDAVDPCLDGLRALVAGR